MSRVVLVPGVPALLPAYASIDDPIPQLRAACREAVAWLGATGGPISTHGTAQGRRIAEHLIAGLDADPGSAGTALLVVGNGSACRTEKAPGFFDPRAEAFDKSLFEALRSPDPAALAGLDQALAGELLADIDSLRWLGAEVLTPGHRSRVFYDDDPFGVQYWVIGWEDGDG